MFLADTPEQAAAVEAEQSGMEHFGRVAMACSTCEDEMVSVVQDAMARDAELSEVFSLMADRNAILLEV